MHEKRAPCCRVASSTFPTTCPARSDHVVSTRQVDWRCSRLFSCASLSLSVSLTESSNPDVPADGRCELRLHAGGSESASRRCSHHAGALALSGAVAHQTRVEAVLLLPARARVCI